MAKRRNRFKFTEKKQSIPGIITLIFAMIFLGLYVAFVGKAAKLGGVLSMYYGSAGVLILLCSVVGFVVAVISTKEEDSFQFFPRLSVVLSFINTVCWVGTYIYGFIKM